MIGKDVKIIEYSRGVDTLNYLTHGFGAVLGLVGAILLIIKAEGFRHTFAAVVYGIALVTVYTVSTVYHSLKNGEAKRIARIVDHSAIPLLIAGTATPCALITLFEVSKAHGMVVFCLAWACTVFGLFSKVFVFEKLKALTMCVYIVCCTAMVFVAVPLLGQIDTRDFVIVVIGCAFYLLSAVLLRMGSKNEKIHPIFHVVVMIGSAFHYYVIFTVI